LRETKLLSFSLLLNDDVVGVRLDLCHATSKHIFFAKRKACRSQAQASISGHWVSNIIADLQKPGTGVEFPTTQGCDYRRLGDDN